MSLITDTLADKITQDEYHDPRLDNPKYRIYWWLTPHCSKARVVRQVNGKTAYVCRHEADEPRR